MNKTKTILKIEMLEYDDGDIKYDVHYANPENKETSSTGLFDTITKALIYSLYETGFLTSKEVNSYCHRIHEDHGEVVEAHLLAKIREGLKNGDVGFEMFKEEAIIVEKTDDELLKEAIENEDYEEAAKLRDKIEKEGK